MLKAIPLMAGVVIAAMFMRSENESRFLKGPAGRLHVDVRGAGGLAVVFVPSLAGNTRQWEPQLAHFALTRQVLALDLRGHGRSDAPSSPAYRPEDYAADIAAALAELKIETAVIVGHSMGSAAALAFANRHPAKVRGLVLVDPVDDPLHRPPDPGSDKFLADLAGPDYSKVIEAYWKQILQNAAPGVEASVLADMKATPKKTVAESIRALSRFEASRVLGAYRGPVLIVTTPLNDFPSSLHRLHPALQHRSMTGVSHWLQLDRPLEFNRILDGFLATIGRSARVRQQR